MRYNLAALAVSALVCVPNTALGQSPSHSASWINTSGIKWANIQKEQVGKADPDDPEFSEIMAQLALVVHGKGLDPKAQAMLQQSVNTPRNDHFGAFRNGGTRWLGMVFVAGVNNLVQKVQSEEAVNAELERRIAQLEQENRRIVSQNADFANRLMLLEQRKKPPTQ